MRIVNAKWFSLIIGCLLLLGCGHSESGRWLQSRSSAPETDDRPVNAYYLFAASHLVLKAGDVDHAIELIQKALAQDPASTYLKRELARLWLIKKDMKTAITLLEDILASHPDDVETLILAGRVHQNIGAQTKAIDAYSRVIKLDPSQQEIYLALGGMYMENEQWDAAKGVYTQLVNHFPGFYAGYFFLGRISALQNDRTAAQTYFKKTLELEPDLVESRFELGSLYEADKKFDQAAFVYGDILKRYPNNSRAKMALGYVCYQQGQKQLATEIFTSLGMMSMTDPNVVRTLVRHYFDSQDYQAAEIIIQGMLKGAPKNADLRYLSGVALDGVGKKDAAIAQLKQVDPGSQFFRNAAIHTALLYQEMDRLQDAIDFLLKAIDQDPNNPEFRLYLGSFYEQAESYDNAEAALRKGIALDPDNPRFYFRLGVVYDKAGNKADSIAAMRQVVALEPDNANALNYLGYTFADMGTNLDEAEQLIRKALEYKPGDGYITDSLAWVFYKRGQYEQALRLLEKAATIVPDDPVIHEHLGDVYHKLGMTKKALDSYRQSIKQGHTDKASIEDKIRQIAP